jgi:hypothetical protein
MDGVLIKNLLVAVPISNAFAHCVRAVEQLHKPHVFFEKPSCKNAVLRKARLVRVRIIRTIGLQGVRGFRSKIAYL